MNHQICVLEDGERVHFSLKRRQRFPFYFVVFRGPDGVRVERSTKERSQRSAAEVAIEVIKAEFRPRTVSCNPSWDEAVGILVEHLRAGNLREPTIRDYGFAVQTLRSMYPQTHGPAEITPAMAEQYKAKRLKNGLSPHSVRGDLTTLKVTYGKWWLRKAKIISVNPFMDIEKPRADRKPPRIINPQEFEEFVAWLRNRWDNWRLPILFLEVKSVLGCRITELASAKTESLTNGRIHFLAETTKGRKQRALRLPAAIYAELESIAGPSYVFERFSGERKTIHRKRGMPHHAATIKSFTPQQMRQWLQDELSLYLRTHPELKRFKLHNLRGTAMSKAVQAGIGYDAASIAFGCHPETMRQHYVNLNETLISDQVMDAIQNQNGHTQTNGESKSEEKFGDSKRGGI